MSSLTVDQEQKWVPTHVQVTVLRARSLRGKGKHGTSDAYTIIQLGKEKYSTCVVEKTTAPEWREECTFDLQPGVLESGSPAGSNQLILTVMHQALMGLDLFLGQAVVPLGKVFSESRCLKNEWYQLKSKTGKKEKERGDIQVTVQFTRDNLTASMFDLVMKDKSMSTFGKLKERMRGKRRSSEEDSSSAILPGGYGSLGRMRQRLPSEGGGEEDYEDDEGGEVRRSKMRTFFLRGKLRKSSDTRSSTSLGSESSESSSRGGSLSPTAGISVVVSDLSNSPSNSSNLTTDNSPEHTANLSPRSPSSLQCEFGDEAAEISLAVPPPTLCVNGSPAYGPPSPDPGSGKPPPSLGLAPLHKPLPLSTSLQNLSPGGLADPCRDPAGAGRRWSIDRPGEEEKAAIAAALEQRGPLLGGDELDQHLGRADPTKDARVASEAEGQGKKQKKNMFSHGRGGSAGKGQNERTETEQTAEEKHKGWFGSKDLHSKPSPAVSAKVEPSTPFPSVPPPTHPPLDFPPLVSPVPHTNPFSPPQSTPPPISPCNPFFSLLQQNPFYDAMLTAQPLRPSLPPLPYLSTSRPPISHLFPRANDPNATPADSVCRGACSDTGTDGMERAGKRPLPPTPAGMASRRSSNPFTPAGGLEPDPQWDDSFEAFAAGRLQPPEGLSAQRQTQRDASASLVKRCSDGRCPSSWDTPRESRSSRSSSANMTPTDGVPLFLETIPEHNDSVALDNPDVPLNNWTRAESNQANSNTNVHFLTNTHTDPGSHHPPAGKLNSGSPDPASSGIGSSVEEDFLSCFSSYSDKFSASSAEESEAQNLDADVIGFEKSAESVGESKPSESDADGSHDRSLRNTVLQRRNGEVLEDWGSPVVEAAADLQPKSKENRKREEFHVPVEDFPPTEVMVSSPPDVLQPTVHIMTSSPDVNWNSAGLPPEGPTGAVQGASTPFEDFPISPGSSCDNLLLPALSSSSFLQSLYVSAHSQNYQTCDSLSPSKCSSSSEANLPANPALRGELGGVLVTAAAQELFADASKPSLEEIHSLERSADVLQPGSSLEDESGSAELPAAPTDPCRRSLADRAPHALSDDTVSKCPHALTLQRSQSAGSLGRRSDGRLGASSAGLPPLPSSAPPTPDHTRSPLALCSLPPFANASARWPPSASRAAAPKPVSLERQQQQAAGQQAAGQQNSPHPVRPLLNSTQAEEKRTEGRSVLATGLEKLKSTIHPGRSSQLSEQEADRKKFATGGAGSYYHLNHSELVALLVQREAELEEQKEEFERQRSLLAKREVELKKLKPQVKDLEDYIDTLLVRIMEQKPTLLQVRSKFK